MLGTRHSKQLFQTDKILIVPELSPEERTIEKEIFGKKIPNDK